ncbi:MAG: class I SAM-dependent methyltransferase [Candidatus Scalindua sp.]
MENNGERFIDNQKTSWDLFLQHVGRYLFASSYVCGKTVLDAACGSGFGSNMISQKAKKVVGIDNSWDAIRYCRERYKKPNLSFLQMDCNRLALPGPTFDAVVSFETLEHIQGADVFLQELSRVLKKDGMIIMSAPNRENFSLYTKGIINPFHVKEFNEDEFTKLIGKHFELKKILGQKFFAKKDIPLLTEYTTKQIPYGSDSIVRRLIRIGLRTVFSEDTRTNYFLSWEVWANKCKVGGIIPSKAVYLIGIGRKY